MCGIFALFYSQSQNFKNYSTQCVDALQSIKHRGPDNTRVIEHKNYFAGFQRLSINDITENGNQPMFSDDKEIFLLCNGEIFNYLDLAKKYNVVLTTKSDCEIILRLYQINQLFVEELNGDFAFLLYDNRKSNVILGRDRMGVRPLFYGFTEDNSFVVGSEVKAMGLCATNRLYHVPPGSTIKYNTILETVEQTFFYDVKNYSIFSTCSQATTEFVLENVRNLLTESTRKRLVSERPIGCLLSGGLDSSIICAILCKLCGPENVRTYSIGMEGSLDLCYARKVATYLGTKHHEVLFTPEEGLNAIPEVVYHLESYDVTTVRASVGMYLLGKYISKHTDDKVIFSGEGSDELFCGYLYFHYAPSPKEAHTESIRLLSEMYKYDVLRADRCISSHGLELRVPFLDPDVIDFATTSLLPELKAPSKGELEKKILRDAFRGYLPEEVLYRRKDGFSDGVSSKQKPWYRYIQEHVDDMIDCTINERKWYKKIYLQHFPNYPNPISYMWMPKWINCSGNPSGRILQVFEQKVV
jgi:asparagine synthase (glutamine-hydrolysing)